MIKDLCTDLLISDRSIHKFGLFTKQIHLSEEDKAAVKLIKETTDPCSITVVEEIVNANCALPSAYIGAITTVDEPPKVIEADIKNVMNSTFSPELPSCESSEKGKGAMVKERHYYGEISKKSITRLIIWQSLLRLMLKKKLSMTRRVLLDCLLSKTMLR